MPDEKRRTIKDRRHQPWEQNPSEEWAYALDHLDRGDFEHAIMHCERAIEIWPTYYDAWLLLAGAHEEQGDFDQALASVQQAGEIAAMELSQAWNNMASYHLMRKEWEQALTVDRILDLIDPTRHPIICYRMAVCFTQLGDHDRAFRLLNEGIGCREDFAERALSEPWLEPLHARIREIRPSGD